VGYQARTPRQSAHWPARASTPGAPGPQRKTDLPRMEDVANRTDALLLPRYPSGVKGNLRMAALPSGPIYRCAKGVPGERTHAYATGHLFHRPSHEALESCNQIHGLDSIRRVRTEFLRTAGGRRCILADDCSALVPSVACWGEQLVGRACGRGCRLSRFARGSVRRHCPCPVLLDGSSVPDR
jgi:hypothetical protein